MIKVTKDQFYKLKFETEYIIKVNQDDTNIRGKAHKVLHSLKEIESDLGIKVENSGNLTRWARQGVMLLNTTLTVRRAQANSHHGKGLEIFTNEVIRQLSARKDPIVFLLWGSNAQSFAPIIEKQHLVLMAPHPSPLSAYRGFFGCKHFSKANEFLVKCGKEPIDWR